VLDALGATFSARQERPLQGVPVRLFRWFDKRAFTSRARSSGFLLKSPLFGCEACGNCVLGSMEYICPQICPKNLRNGPCGGTHLGRCEVVDQPCIWAEMYERAKTTKRIEGLRVYIPGRNTLLSGTSSWINYFLNRDHRPERKAQLYRPNGTLQKTAPKGMPRRRITCLIESLWCFRKALVCSVDDVFADRRGILPREFLREGDHPVRLEHPVNNDPKPLVGSERIRVAKIRQDATAHGHIAVATAAVVLVQRLAGFDFPGVCRARRWG